MKRNRLICWLLLVLILLSSCTNTNNNTDNTSDTSDTTATQPQNNPPASETITDLEIVKDSKSEYTILLDMENAMAKTFATFLQKEISLKTGAMLPMRNIKDAARYEKKIIIGDSSAGEIADLKASTKEMGFSAAVKYNTLVLFASDWQGFLSMEDYVKTELFKDASKASFVVKKMDNYVFDAASAGDSFVFDSSKQYTLVYSVKTATDPILAKKIVKYLKDNCGLNVKEGSDASTHENEIIFGDVNREIVGRIGNYFKDEESYFFGARDGAYVINSDSRLGLAMGIVQLSNTIKAAGGKALTVAQTDGIEGLVYDFPKDDFFANSVALAKSVYGTYSSIMELQVTKLSTDIQNDIKLVDKIVLRLGKNAVFCIGSSSALYDGFIVKCDLIDYSKVTKTDGSNHIWVAEDFARSYFGSTVSVVDGYVDITALCDGTNYTLYFDSAKGIAVVTPKGGTVFSAADSNYIDRMYEFFHNPVIPEPDLAVEQTRQEIISIDHDPKYIYDYTEYKYECYASPEILVHKGNGGAETIYMAYDISMMHFPNGTNTTINTDTAFSKSTDGGKTWTEIKYFKNVTYVGLIEYNGKIILMGTRRDIGNAWVATYNISTGEIKDSTLNFSVFGTAPTAILVHEGRIYRAHNGGVISADLSSDILKTETWVRSESPNDLLPPEDFVSIIGYKGKGNNWIEEGNVVLGKDGTIYAIYRIDCGTIEGYATIFTLSKDGRTLKRAKSDKCLGDGVISFPGNQSKFQIKYDEKSGKYLSFVSVTTGDSYNQRNVLYLIASDDLFTWEKIGQPILVERQIMNNKLSEYSHAFQYASFDFSGDDILLIIREATGNSCNYHNSNAITLYTFENYAAYISENASN